MCFEVTLCTPVGVRSIVDVDSEMSLAEQCTTDNIQWQDVSTRRSLSTAYKMRSSKYCKQLAKTFRLKHPAIEHYQLCTACQVAFHNQYQRNYEPLQNQCGCTIQTFHSFLCTYVNLLCAHGVVLVTCLQLRVLCVSHLILHLS